MEYRNIPTKNINGHEFVELDDFLSCFPNLDNRTREKIKSLLIRFEGTIEKRVEEPFVRKLLACCWNPPGDRGQAYTTPIVLGSKWVIWTDRGHEPIIDLLGKLFVPREEKKQSIEDALAILSGDVTPEYEPPNIDLLTGGFAWYISTEDPKVVIAGRAYQPTDDDRVILSTFPVRYID
tara:strand:+ start:481 stop:1017 length:537 start_codon:yes stop_codon:yes gene_type:complete